MRSKKNKLAKESTASIGFESRVSGIWRTDGKCSSHRIDMSPAYGSATAHAGFVQSEKFLESHGGKLGDISIYGQEKRAWGARFGHAKRARRVRLRRKQPNQSNATTRRLAVMNLAKRGFRDRRKQTLFIDARKLVTLIDRVHRELTDADLEKITSTYHLWLEATIQQNLKGLGYAL